MKSLVQVGAIGWSMVITKRFLLTLVMLVAAIFVASNTTFADDIYSVSVPLKPGEAYTKVKRLPKGTYTAQVTHAQGDAESITLEAELAGVSHYHGAAFTSDTTVTKIDFTVKNDGDIWEITLTNKSDDKRARVNAKLTKD